MRMRLRFVLVLLVLQAASLQAAPVEQISRLIDEGLWRQARAQIAQESSRTNLSFQERQALLFQSDRLQRMGLDFHKTREQVLQEARAIAPSITEAQFAAWE